MKKLFFKYSLFTIMYICVLASSVYLIPFGNDFIPYSEIFSNNSYERIELGFLNLIYIFKFFNINNLLFMWIIIISFTMYLKMNIVYKLNPNNQTLFLILYLMSYYLLLENVQLRACISLSLVIFAIYKLSDNKYIFSFIFIILAIFFHKSSLLFLIIFPLYYFLIRNKIDLLFTIFCIFTIAVYFVLDEFLFDFLIELNPLVIEYYNEGISIGFNFFSISQILIYLFVFTGYFNYNDGTIFSKLIYILIIILLFISMCLYFIPTVAIRISDMIGLFTIFYLMSFNLYKFKLKRLFLIIIVFIISIHKFISFMFFFPIFK